MKQRNALIFLAAALLVLVLGACSPQAATQPTPADLPPEPVVKAQNWLAEKLSVPADQVEIVSYTSVDWSDSCLGLGGPAESCLQAITPGYQVTLQANGQEYEARTNLTGEAIRSPQFSG